MAKALNGLKPLMGRLLAAAGLSGARYGVVGATIVITTAPGVSLEQLAVGRSQRIASLHGALTGAPGGDQLVRRAARLAVRSKAELLAVHVQRDDGVRGPSTELPVRHRELVCTLNLHLLRAALAELGAPAQARLDPAEGRCCVTIAAGGAETGRG